MAQRNSSTKRKKSVSQIKQTTKNAEISQPSVQNVPLSVSEIVYYGIWPEGGIRSIVWWFLKTGFWLYVISISFAAIYPWACVTAGHTCGKCTMVISLSDESGDIFIDRGLVYDDDRQTLDNAFSEAISDNSLTYISLLVNCDEYEKNKKVQSSNADSSDDKSKSDLDLICKYLNHKPTFFGNLRNIFYATSYILGAREGYFRSETEIRLSIPDVLALQADSKVWQLSAVTLLSWYIFITLPLRLFNNICGKYCGCSLNLFSIIKKRASRIKAKRNFPQ
jgi:hypothetical protein